ncbi:MAG: FKBP-type peptidyl-prolyl cis-trans isomerase [Rhizorhabdus sp.]|nr:FKBP-type peptidyl-prolyl cis-trans isomerase [Rhizorhabdus sp.]
MSMLRQLVAPFVVLAALSGTPAIAQTVDTTQALRVEDLEAGAGTEAQTGRTLVVHYTGWFYDPVQDERGRKFDSSHGGTPLSFRLGAGLVIKGWDDGLIGMRVGGVRTLIVPPDQAYGRKGKGPVPPDSWLMFEIELLDVK